jgi:uncharacterized membrane protein HdeD (DUF308 family)
MSDGKENRSVEQNEAVRLVTASWQAVLFVGFVLLVLGIIVAAHPTTSLNVICVLIGIMVLIAGVFRLIRSLDREDEHRAMNAVVGIALIIVGLILIRHLHLSRLLVALVVGITFIVQGAVDLVVGFSGDSARGRGWLIFIGLVSIAAGIVVLAVPEGSVTTLAVLVGIWFIVLGVLQMIWAFVIRHELKKATEA